jgi:hypothetical protein
MWQGGTPRSHVQLVARPRREMQERSRRVAPLPAARQGYPSESDPGWCGVIWRGGKDRQPVTVEHTVPPADVVPTDTPEVVASEQHARMRHILRLAQRTLLFESGKPVGLRNTALIDLCLEIRSALLPSAPGTEVLREPPLPVQGRYGVPVTPGGRRE